MWKQFTKKYNDATDKFIPDRRPPGQKARYEDQTPMDEIQSKEISEKEARAV